MSASEARAIAEQILADLDLGDWAALVPEIQELLLAVTEDGIAVGFGQIGFDATAEITEQVNARALEWAKERAAELVGMRVDAEGALIVNPDARWAITEGTRAWIKGDVEIAIENGSSTDVLAQVLEASYAFSPERAEMVARTELARADVAGNLISYRDSGVVEGKEWALGSEHGDEDECDEAAALGVVALDSDFGGAGDPPAHPGCVCDILPVLVTEADTGEVEE
jgi:hypothetical protein